MASDHIKQLLYDLLLKYKNKHNITIYSYSLMDNHPHINGYVIDKFSISKFMQTVHSVFAKKLNKLLSRKGQVVMDRPSTKPIENENHLLNSIIYHDLNAVRAGIVENPREYKWSSYKFYAYGKFDPLITPAPSYIALGPDNETRQRIYRKMVDDIIDNEVIEKEVLTIISNKYFIGDPNWVLNKYKELKNKIKEKKNQNLHLNSSPP
jgi:putative transposase